MAASPPMSILNALHPLRRKSMRTRITFRSVLPFLALLLAAGSAQSIQAQELSPSQGFLNDKFVFNLGTFVVASDLRATLNGSTNTNNQEIDFDHTFGKASDANRVRVDGMWRINPDHHIRVLWFDNTKTTTRSLAQDIEWGDNIYHAGATVTAESKFSVVELAYEWSFLHTPTYEVAATFGMHYMDMSLKLTGNASLAGPSNSAQVSYTSKDNSVPMPLPVIGIRAGWSVSPHWYLEASGQVFKAKYDVYDGTWNDLRANATWMFNRHFGLGAGYNVFFTRLTVNKAAYDGVLRMGYSGVQVFATIGF
jgi:hypothetical protein